MSPLKAIYFDLDDTLCGYWAASTVALREAFDVHNPGSHTTDELLAHWATAFRDFVPEIKTERWYPGYLVSGEVTRTEQMRRTLQRAGIPDEALASQISETYMKGRNANLRLFPDARKVLDTLKAIYPLGLITNGPADIQRMEIEALGIGDYFQNVFIEGEVGLGKPHQEVFRRAATAVGFEPSEILFVGNSYGSDIFPAITAGWETVWIRRPLDIPSGQGGAHTAVEELPEGKPGPDHMITELSELLPILGI